MVEPVRLGCLGHGTIAALAAGRPSRQVAGVEVVAVAGRSPARASVFAEKYRVGQVYDDPAALLAAPDIDAVYVALPNRLHFRWAMAALAAGKHVLVEKPICMGQAELARIEERAGARGLVCMEALMVAHHAWPARLVRIAQEGGHGALVAVETTIHFPLAAHRLETMPPLEEGGGASTDVGPYWTHLLQLVSSGPLELHDLSIEARSGRRPFDVECDARATLASGVVARLRASFARPYQAEHRLAFERGEVVIHDLFRPNIGRSRLDLVEVDRNGDAVTHSLPGENYYVNQLDDFACAVRTGRRSAGAAPRVRAYELVRHAVARALGRSQRDQEADRDLG